MKNMFSSVFLNKKVFVTGNTGFKGSWLSFWLTKMGAKVTGFSLDIPTVPSFYGKLNLDQYIDQQVWGDVRDFDAFNKAFMKSKADIIFHLAAQPIVKASIDNPLETFETNVLGTANLLSIILKNDRSIPTVIITSDKCYENKEWVWGYRENDQLGGVDPYSASKACAEIIFSSMSRTYPELNIASARAGNVIGGGDWAANRVVADAVRHWEKGQVLNVRSPNATRPWQHVLEPICGYLRLGELLIQNNNRIRGESFNFGPSEAKSYSVQELLNRMSKYWPSNTPQFKTNSECTIEAGLLKLNCDKAKCLLDWQQRLSFDRTVEYTMDWYWGALNNLNLDEITSQQIDEYCRL